MKRTIQQLKHQKIKKKDDKLFNEKLLDKEESFKSKNLEKEENNLTIKTSKNIKNDEKLCKFKIKENKRESKKIGFRNDESEEFDTKYYEEIKNKKSRETMVENSFYNNSKDINEIIKINEKHNTFYDIETELAKYKNVDNLYEEHIKKYHMMRCGCNKKLKIEEYNRNNTGVTKEQLLSKLRDEYFYIPKIKKTKKRSVSEYYKIFDL